MALILAGVSAGRLQAQSIVLRGGSAVSTQAGANSKVVVPVIVDMTNAAGASFASITVDVSWNAARLVFDSVKATAFGALAANTNNANAGAITLSVFDPTGTTTTQTIANLYFSTTAANPGGTRVQLTPSVAGDASGTNILSLFRLQHLDVCVSNSTGVWGDANGDANVNIIDAQQIARFSVGLSVGNVALLTAEGDVNGDGNTNIIDAQQIARFSVGLIASARVNTMAFLSAPTSSLQLSQTTGTLYVGMSGQVSVTPLDATSTPLNGCRVVVWSSGTPSVATADSTGRITGVSVGTSTITVLSGGKTTQGVVTVLAAGPASTVTAVSGDQQWTYVSSSALVAPSVIVRDASNVPVPNAPVVFTANGGTFNGGQPLLTQTDVNGLAFATGWTPAASGATMSMTASVQGVATPATITVNLISGVVNQTTCIKDAWGGRCWGAGTRGQLGNGLNTSTTTPVDVTNPVNAPLVSFNTQTSGDHFCGLDAAGLAYCWGWNAAGQLGDGTRVDRGVPTAVAGNLVFTSIATGLAHTCGVAGGDVYCWGINPHGQLGDSLRGTTYLVPTKAKTPTGVAFSQVTAGANFSCALATTGDAYCWGNNNGGQLGDGSSGSVQHLFPFAVVGGLHFSQIASSFGNTCGLSGGAAYCWGQNGSGQLGTTPGGNIGVPTLITGGHSFVEISTGQLRACGVKASPDDSTWCWGQNGNSLGDGSNVDRQVPTLLPAIVSNIMHGGPGVGYACGTSPGGSQTLCWGNNNTGQLGDGTTTTHSIPTVVPRVAATVGAPLSIEAQIPSAAAQSGGTSALVPIAPSVIVRDGFGSVVANVTVNWTTLSGGGNPTNSTSLTDAQGVATSSGWTLGAASGAQTLQATVNGIIVNGSPSATPLHFTFFATASANLPAFAVKIEGDSTYYASSTNAGGFRVPQIVKVTDASNNPLPNIAVTFTLGASSGTIGGGGGPFTTNTDAAGLATLPSAAWAPNTTINAQSTVTATVAGFATPLVFTHFRANNSFGLVSCELTNAGAAMCVGSNTYGTVGDGTTTTRTTFVPVSGGLAFTSLAEGVAMAKCGLVSTTAYCWGSNSMGQLGDGTQIDRTVPTPVSGGLAFSQLALGGSTTCGITTAQQLYCWGWSGDVGLNEGLALVGRIHLVPTLINTNGLVFTKITLGDNGVCGLTAAGTIHCVSANMRGDGPVTLTNSFTQWINGPYIDVQAGNTIACALDTSGIVYCIGSNQSGAQGQGNGTSTAVFNNTPAPVLGGFTFADIHVQNIRACGRRANGDVYCWGGNSGTGSPGPVDRPTQIAGFKAASVRMASFRNTCAKALSGQLYCWGPQSSGLGYVGDGTTIDRVSPVAVPNWPDGAAAGVPATISANATSPGTQFGAIPLSPNPSVTVKDRFGTGVPGITVTFSAPPGSGTVVGGSAVTDASGIATIGSWTLPQGPGTARLDATVPGLPSLVYQVILLQSAGSITASNGNNQFLPDFYTSTQSLSATVLDASNQPIIGAAITFTISGSNGTLGGLASTNIQVTTGANGIGTLFSAWNPPQTAGQAYTVTASVPGLAPITYTARRLLFSFNGGDPGASSCRISASSNTYCWGGNFSGSVGDGSNTNRTAPVQVTSVPTLATLGEGAIGFHHCGLTTAGAAYCWGDNDAGQLGNGTRVNSNTAVAVLGGLTFSKIFTGPYSTCALTTANALYCWGWASYSFLGDGQLNTAVSTPTAVNTGGRTFNTVSIGGRAVCAIDATGQAFCWGQNFAGQIGNNTTVSSPTPVAVQTALRFISLSSGFDFTCGVTTASQVACWGFNGNGQIGNGTTTNQLTPFLHSINSVSEVRATEITACARAATVFCWGYGGGGTIGNGSFTSPQSTPVSIGSGMTPTSLPSFARGVACASSASVLYCWGNSLAGVGDGTGATRSVPTAVRWVDSPAGTAATISSNSGVSTLNAAPTQPTTMSVKVVDAFGTAVVGAPVAFVVTSGGGSLTTNNTTSDASGNATTSWTLAGAVGSVGTMEARVSSVPSFVFSGTIQNPTVAISSLLVGGLPANISALKGSVTVNSTVTGAQVSHIDVSLTSGSTTVVSSQLFGPANLSNFALSQSFNTTAVAPGNYTLNVQMYLNGVASPATSSIGVTIIP